MLEALDDNFIPEEILFRESQLEKIRKIFDDFKKFGRGTNLIITGVTGAGKTILTKKIIQERNNCIYVNGSNTRTPVNTLKSICKVKLQQHGEVLEETLKLLKEHPKIIIIDEIDKIKKYNEVVNDLNTIYRYIPSPIILVTCKRNFIEKIPIDAKKTLWFERMSLPSYNALELKEIIKSRLKLIKMEIPELNDSFISKLCAYGAKSGSCRITLNILLRCIQKNSFTEKDLDEINDFLNDIDWGGFYNDLNDTEKRFLSTLCSSCDNKKECTSLFLSEELLRFWNFKLTPGRISQLIDFFTDYDIITSRHENNGRSGGRSRLIKFKCREIYETLSKFTPY